MVSMVEAAAAEDLIQEAYHELRHIAGQLLRNEREGHTLQRTALVHETFIRLFEKHAATALSARNFLGLAAHQMRMILVDYSRKHRADKRGGQWLRVPLFDTHCGIRNDDDSVLALDEALERLGKIDQRAYSVVELKFFGGFTSEETAEILGVSYRTIERDWQFARVWLYGALGGEERMQNGEHPALNGIPLSA